MSDGKVVPNPGVPRPSACLDESLRKGQPDAARAPGDERHLAVEPELGKWICHGECVPSWKGPVIRPRLELVDSTS